MRTKLVKRVVLCLLLLGGVIGIISGCFLFPNRPPVASFTVLYNVAEDPEDPMVVDLDATASSDPDGDEIIHYLWKFGNENDDVEILTPLEYTKQVDVPILRVRYPDEGIREARLVVTDERGAISEPVVQTITLPQDSVEPTS